MMNAYNRQKVIEQIPDEWNKFEKHLREKNISVEDFFNENESVEDIIRIIRRKVKNFKL